MARYSSRAALSPPPRSTIRPPARGLLRVPSVRPVASTPQRCCPTDRSSSREAARPPPAAIPAVQRTYTTQTSAHGLLQDVCLRIVRTPPPRYSTTAEC